MKRHTGDKRKNYLIDRTFQFKFITKFCSLIIIASLLTGFLIYHFNQKTTTVAFENMKVVVKSTSNFILPIVLQILVIVTLLVSVGTVLVALFTSHKISGPLYRLRAEMEKAKEGDLSSTTRIRAADQLKTVVSEFDDMRRGIGRSVGKIKEDWASLKAALLKLQPKIGPEEEKKLRQSVDSIDSKLERFKT